LRKLTGYSLNWIRVIAHRYNQDGPSGLGDRRHANPGGKPLVPVELQTQLRQILQGPAPDSGVWTGRKVAGWLQHMTGRKVYPQRGWDYLKRLGFVRYSPRPRHVKADKDQQEAFKRDLPTEVANIQRAYPEANVEAWAFDEHRVGLKPILRRVWARHPAIAQ
jgi:transposase